MKNIYLDESFNELEKGKEKAYYIIVRSPVFCGLDEGYYKKSKIKDYTKFLNTIEIDKLTKIDEKINNSSIDMSEYILMINLICGNNIKVYKTLTRNQISYILQILCNYQKNCAINMVDIITVLNLFEDREKTEKQREFFKKYIEENNI